MRSPETKRRSLFKTISWRVTASSSSFIISYTVLGSAALAGGITLLQLVANTILYYIHERLWNRVRKIE